MSSTATVATTVRKATQADAARVGDTLSAAFFNDPVMKWIYPDTDRRTTILPKFFRVVLDATMPYGGIDTVADDVAASVWVPDDADNDEDAMAAEMAGVSAEYAERLFTVFELGSTHHPQEPHDYLFLLGTRPEWQSHGLGSALLRSALSDCDRRGMPAYLQATSEGSRQLYLRHGFEVAEIITLPDGPPLWCMWRTPGGAA